MTAPELAARTGATPAQIEELVASGIVTLTADGAFAVVDSNRVRIAQALASEGYALADVARLVARGALSLDPIKYLKRGASRPPAWASTPGT
jgi:hypothetical protein